MITTKPRQGASIGRFFKDNWNDFVYAWKDLKSQRAKTFFAIAGITISIFIMQVVGVITDSLSYSYLDASATNMGAADFTITRSFSTSGGGGFGISSLFMNQTEVQARLDTVDELGSVHPRLVLFPLADIVNPLPQERLNRTVTLYGLDVQAEDAGGLGRFTHAGNGSTFNGQIPEGYCIISTFINSTLRVGVGDNITLRYLTFPPRQLTVLAVVVQEQKFTMIEVDTIVTNLEWVQESYALEDNVNYFQCMMENREYIYDTRNVDGTIDRMIQIAGKIQAAIGDKYDVQMLKLQDLEGSEMMNLAMSVAFIFISIISMIIGAILINSILTTAVEERIKEFGIFRVLGGRRAFPFKLVLYQGLALSVIGAIIGIVLGTLFAQVALPVLYNWLNMWTNPIQLIVQPLTIITVFGTGVGMTMLVTAFPAYRAASTKIIEAINPYRHQKTGWVVKKEGRINTQLISSGLAAVAAGSLVFYLIPQLAITGDVSVIIAAFIGVQLAFLFGLMFISLGFIPGLQWIALQVFRIFNKKTTPVVRTSLYRYRRRNTSTVLMFSMTFAFILFISTMVELMRISQTYTITVNYGTPMVLYSLDVRNQVDEDLGADVLSTPGVGAISMAYSDAIDIATIQLAISQSGLGELDFGTLFGSDRYYVEVGDLISYYDYTAALIGVDENYAELMPEELMEVTGGKATVESLFDTDANNIIIAKSAAEAAQLGIGDNIRLTFWDHNTRVRLVNATIAGISDGMPGFWQFREARLTSFYCGVMVSKENYLEWMDLPTDNAPVAKIFIDCNDTSVQGLDALRNNIQRTYEEEYKEDGEQYNFIVEHSQARVQLIEESLSTVNLLFQTLLVFTIFIALFGLMSSVYSTVIERKREIGILKAIGLRNRDTRNMFIMESVIMLVSAATGGAIIGILSAMINAYEQTAISEVPIAVITNLANIPWLTIMQSFGVAILACLAGMILLLRRIEKMEVMEIFRATQ